MCSVTLSLCSTLSPRLRLLTLGQKTRASELITAVFDQPVFVSHGRSMPLVSGPASHRGDSRRPP